jgi:hypothetical protein
MNNLHPNENLFLNKLNNIIQELKCAYNESYNKNISYKFLIDNLSVIYSVSDLRKESNRILYFLADRYDGDPKVISELEIFLLGYREKKK